MSTVTNILNRIPSFLNRKPSMTNHGNSSSSSPVVTKTYPPPPPSPTPSPPSSSLSPSPSLFLPSQLPEDAGKLTVVLDLDETLVHSKLPRANEFRQEEDRKLDCNQQEYSDYFEVSVFSETFRVHKRPGLDQFLEEASKHYELVCFTAGIEDYARVLMDKIDPEGKYFRHRLFRNHCVQVGGSFVKDLSVLNRSMERCVLVDNNAFSFLFQLGNGIPVASFYDDAKDMALQTLLAFLSNLKDHRDVREHLRSAFSLETLLGEPARQAIEYHLRQQQQNSDVGTSV